MPALERLISPSDLAGVADLELLARGVVEGFLAGLHRSPRSGAATEFAQYRPYAQGDDLRLVDWRLYARTDRLHCKQSHEETNLRCTILLDCSASMGYSSRGMTKFHYARILAACLAAILDSQKDASGLLAWNEDIIHRIAPRGDARHLRRMIAALDGLKPARGTDAPSALRFLGETLKPRGMVVLITDLLHPLEEVLPQIRSLRARRHDVMIFQIGDPAERTFPFELSQTFIDMEDSREVFAVPQVVRDAYLENRARHFDAVRRECLESEIELQELSTDQPLDLALRAFLHRRNRALMTSSPRRTRAAGGGH